MLLRKFSMSLSALAILLAGSLILFAQSAPVRGKVELKKADGTLVPVANAVVDVYRTDVKAKLPSGKTDKKGQFVFAGLPLGATMTFAVSGPGIKAEIYPGVKAGREDVNITVYEGDGTALSEEQVRSALTTAPTQAQGGQETAEQKKAREEYEKQVAEVGEKNKKIENTNNIVKASLEQGSKAYQDKNYDLAVAKFQEGIEADPDFAGSATVLNNNKALALRMRGFDAYKQGMADAANKASWMEKAKNDFTGSIAASQKTIQLIGAITDGVEAKKFDQAKYSALANLVEANRLMIATNADTSKTADAVAALEAYMAVETDAALKVKNQIYVADALRLAGNSGEAVPIYRKVLETDPNHVEALGGLGLSLLNEGEIQGKIELSQEGLNLMQKFTEVAPDTHPLKNDVKLAVTYLKDEKKLVPQKLPKTTTPAKGKKP
jgi:tetratricopeptide (TPR) repeat protein